MALLKFGNGIIEIRGTLSGNYYHRDGTGHHCCRLPRHINKRTTAQAKQRNAFTKARRFCSIPICISTNIYRALNNLELHHFNNNRERVSSH